MIRCLIISKKGNIVHTLLIVMTCTKYAGQGTVSRKFQNFSGVFRGAFI